MPTVATSGLGLAHGLPSLKPTDDHRGEDADRLTALLLVIGTVSGGSNVTLMAPFVCSG